MKIRQGFVSNSSSTSFYIDASKHSKEKVEEVIQRMLDLLSFCHDSPLESINSICQIEETNDIGGVKEKIRMHYNYNQSIFIDPNDDIGREKWPNKIIVVDSTDDNSIPYAIQDFLEDAFCARRQHWG